MILFRLKNTFFIRPSREALTPKNQVGANCETFWRLLPNKHRVQLRNTQWSTMVQALEHQARLHDPPCSSVSRVLQQCGASCFQQGLKGDHEHQNFFQCERTFRMRETVARARRQLHRPRETCPMRTRDPSARE